MGLIPKGSCDGILRGGGVILGYPREVWYFQGLLWGKAYGILLLVFFFFYFQLNSLHFPNLEAARKLEDSRRKEGYKERRIIIIFFLFVFVVPGPLNREDL